MKEFRLVAFGDQLNIRLWCFVPHCISLPLGKGAAEKIRSFVGRYIIAASTEKPPEKRKNGWKVRCFG